MHNASQVVKSVGAPGMHHVLWHALAVKGGQIVDQRQVLQHIYTRGN